MNVVPITPAEAAKKKISRLPAQVIEAFNELLAENYNKSGITISQDIVVTRIQSKMDISREDIFSNKFLDVEPLYRKYGWDVTYDKPGYNELYTAFYVFTPKSS